MTACNVILKGDEIHVLTDGLASNLYSDQRTVAPKIAIFPHLPAALVVQGHSRMQSHVAREIASCESFGEVLARLPEIVKRVYEAEIKPYFPAAARKNVLHVFGWSAETDSPEHFMMVSADLPPGPYADWTPYKLTRQHDCSVSPPPIGWKPPASADDFDPVSDGIKLVAAQRRSPNLYGNGGHAQSVGAFVQLTTLRRGGITSRVIHEWPEDRPHLEEPGSINNFGGQITFPATQRASADANTLDDYKEGTWTPVLTFATPGDLSVTYAGQVGFYTKIGRQVTAHFLITTSAFTHTTASGALQVTGLPFTSANVSNQNAIGTCFWGGITKANYTHVNSRVLANSNVVTFVISGSGQATAALAAADMPTGGSVVLQGAVTFVT